MLQKGRGGWGPLGRQGRSQVCFQCLGTLLGRQLPRSIMVLLQVAVSEKDQHGWGWQQVLVSAGTFPPPE